jgi:nucleoid DNA-binding protein
MTLTKAILIETISDQVGYPKNHSSEIVEILLEIIKNSLESRDNING